MAYENIYPPVFDIRRDVITYANKTKIEILDPFEIDNLTNIFEKGSIAMVKSGERNSSSTEFFFVTDKFPELDGRYSIFGKVIEGIEVLEKINKDDFIYEITISN